MSSFLIKSCKHICASIPKTHPELSGNYCWPDVILCSHSSEAAMYLFYGLWSVSNHIKRGKFTAIYGMWLGEEGLCLQPERDGRESINLTADTFWSDVLVL